MDPNFIKAGLKVLLGIVAVVTGGTLLKKGQEDYKRGKEQQANNKKTEKVTSNQA